MILEVFLYGFITAFGWWSANHYVIDPYFPAPIEKVELKNKEKQKEN
jgi:hypothetical protein